MLSRRNFVKIAGVIPATAGMSLENNETGNNTKPAKGARIKSITLTAVTGNFVRFVGMNAYDTAPKGIKSGEELVRVIFDDGTEGLSVTGYSQIDDEVIAKMKALIGKDPFSFYTWNGDRISGVTNEMKSYFFDTKYAWIEGAMLDAIGKQKKIPVWKLFGNSVREGIDAYDGALYFEEIASNRDISIIGEVAKKIKNEGYKGIKIKLGRPAKWLPGEAGLNRDIEAFITLREAVGWNFNLMADANNGYDNHFDWAVKLLKTCAPYDMYWMEEIFADDTPMYLKLREELMKDNLFVPVAEGETLMGNDDPRYLNRFDKYLEHGVYNFLQPDMRTYGISNMIAFAGKAMKYPHVKIAPHNWNSQMGVIMCLHAAKVCPNISMVEDDRFFNHAITLPGFKFFDGQWFIGEQPGWGITLASDYKKLFMIRERTIA